MMQRIRQAEKEMIYEEFKDRAGEIVSGTVRRFERSDVIVDLGKFEAIMPQRERVRGRGLQRRRPHPRLRRRGRERHRAGRRSSSRAAIRISSAAFSKWKSARSPTARWRSRGIAREAGYRTKIAVTSANEKVDPVGACVGMRGSRVKNIVRELNNEKVDIIRWSADPKEFVLEALKPAKMKNLVFDREKKSVQITVDEDQLSLAIGKKGQNARLTSRLTGWEINIEKDKSARRPRSSRRSRRPPRPCRPRCRSTEEQALDPRESRIYQPRRIARCRRFTISSTSSASTKRRRRKSTPPCPAKQPHNSLAAREP